MREPAVEATPALAPLIDPNLHSCGTVRPHGEAALRHAQAGFYIAGMESYGRAPTFLCRAGQPAPPIESALPEQQVWRPRG